MTILKKYKKSLIAVLSIILALATLLSFSSCNVVEVTPDATDEIESVKETGDETEPVETMRVAVFSMNAVRGNMLNERRVELADVPITDLPIDPITNLSDIIGHYVICDVDKGTCVSSSMISATDPLVSLSGLGEGYVLITDVINANPDITDTATLIQKAIDDNPNKTIYFPDGKYQLSKTVVIPSDPEKSVSLRLSNYAVFYPSNKWNTETDTALVRYGSPEAEKTAAGAHSSYFMGGILNGDGKVTGIEINGGGRLFLNNVSIKDVTLGIHIKPNAAYNDIENVNVTAKNSNGTKGVLVEGTNNTLTHMRIYRVRVGVHLTGGDNVLMNIHPLFSGTNSIEAIGFYDESSGNRYSVCYSDQFSVGFKLGPDTRSYFDTCYMYWWAACSYQIGFMCEGDFNSIISDTAVSMEKASNGGNGTENHYIFFIDESAVVEPEEEEEGEEEEEDNRRPSQGGNRPGSSSSNTVTKLNSRTPAGSGKIINPCIPSERYSDSDTYKTFLYSA